MKRSREKEQMDLADKPREVYLDDLRNLRGFNRYLGGCRTVLKGLRTFTRAQRVSRLSLLDVGSASGDIARAAVEWARRRGIQMEIVALELDPLAAQEARYQSHAYPEISVVRGDAARPPFRAGAFDMVVASQFLHHFSEQEIVGLLQTWARTARRAILVSDLVRHPIAYHGIRWISRIVTDNPMTRIDAPLSVERAFTLQEWRRLFQTAAVGSVHIRPVFPFRQMALVDVGGAPCAISMRW